MQLQYRTCIYEPTGGEVSAMGPGRYTWTVFAEAPAAAPKPPTAR